ncbi:LruC domain-containing protein [Flavobacteriaceae bacterium]|nr:LruC domain-containing protein [Flavobacteriaceae bacterium]
MKSGIKLIIFTLLLLGCEKTYYFTDQSVEVIEPDGVNGNLIIPPNFDFDSTEDQTITITGNNFPEDTQVNFSLYQMVDTTATLVHKGYLNTSEGFEQLYAFPNHIKNIKVQAFYGEKTFETELPKEELSNLSLNFDEFTNPEAITNSNSSVTLASRSSMTGNGVAAPSYSCPTNVTRTFTSSDSGNYTLTGNNKTYKVTGPGIFTGQINNWVYNGNFTLYICNGATWKPSSTNISNPKFKVIVLEGGTLDLTSTVSTYTFSWNIDNLGTVKKTSGTLMPINGSVVKNWGTMNFNKLDSQGTFRNYEGTITTNGTFEINGGNFYNEGGSGVGATINVGSNFTANNTFKNYSKSELHVTGTFTNNHDITNSCKITAEDFTSNANVNLSGEGAHIDVEDLLLINNGNFSANGSSGNHLIQARRLTSSKNLTFNSTTNYSLLEITGAINFYTSTNRIRGKIYVCSSSYNSNMGNGSVIESCSASVAASTCSPGYNSNPDTDGDGVYDDTDVEPTNPDVASYNYPQGQGSYYTSIFEDLWPCKGDFDFNDLVTLYTFREGVSSASEIKELQFILKFAAIGAAKDNGFSIRVMGNATMNDQVLNGVTYARYYDSTNGTTIFTFYNLKAALSRTSSSIINTVTSDISADSYLQVSGKIKSIGNGYDFFLTQNSDTTQELHPLTGNVGSASALTKPSARMDTSLMNTCWDTSNTATEIYDHTGQYFLDATGMPWGMIIPTTWAWPKEKESILSTYNNLEDYVESGKSRSTDWYLDNSANRGDGSKVFRH